MPTNSLVFVGVIKASTRRGKALCGGGEVREIKGRDGFFLLDRTFFSGPLSRGEVQTYLETMEAWFEGNSFLAMRERFFEYDFKHLIYHQLTVSHKCREKQF